MTRVIARAAIAFLLLVTACSSSVSTHASTSAATPSPTVVASGSTSPDSTLPLTTLDFACRLPVYAPVSGIPDAFVTFPAASVSDAGKGGYYFDAAVNRWLPVPRAAVSPDGRRYAYTEGWSASPASKPRVHVVNAATGADIRVATMPDAQPYTVIDFTASAVYLGIRYEGSAPGVWRLDPTTGLVSKVSSSLYTPDDVWLGQVDPRDPAPYLRPFDGGAEPDRIDYRVGGATTTWLYRPGQALYWMPFAGSPALLVLARWGTAFSGGYDLWLLFGPNQANRLATFIDQHPSPYNDIATSFFHSIADRHGIWIGGQQSIYLVTPAGAIQRVYPSEAYPANGCI